LFITIRVTRAGAPVNKNDGTYAGVAEIIGTQVFYHDRVYVAIGRDAAMGRGRDALHCIDATKAGDISRSGSSGPAWDWIGPHRRFPSPMA
jgi:hypothetical protein